MNAINYENGVLTMNKYLTVKQTAENFPAFSEASIRFHLFHSQSNNLDKAVRRIGRKILINSALFEEWIENQNGGAS